MENNHDSVDQTNFGFRKVSFDDKKKLVQDVFSNVASKYDLMNDLMSLGVHRIWKNEFIHHIPNLKSNILDVASGSGDIAFRLIKRAKLHNINTNITLCDINPDMLQVARSKAIDNNLLQNIEYICADAAKLPFPDNSFDYYTISFGIRNMSKIENVLSEAYRVLKPTGKFLCLEFAKVELKCLKSFYNFYSFNIIPRIGKLVTHNEEAYQYLVESINLFPDQDSFKIMIQEIGFNKVNYKNLSFGIAAIHSAYKL